MLRGREMQHSALAIELANKFIADLANDPIVLEKKPMVEGRNVTAWLAPQN
jgi:translation initiation factor IF-3